MARGFTLAEMLATMTVMAVVVVAVVPAFEHDNKRLQLRAAAEILTSDIELARVMTMGAPQNPVVVGFGNSGTSYWLARDATPTTPMVRDDTGETYYVSFGSGRAAAADGIAFTLAGMTGTGLEFDEHGALTDFTKTPVIQLRIDDDWIELEISPATGSITQTWGEGAG